MTVIATLLAIWVLAGEAWSDPRATLRRVFAAVDRPGSRTGDGLTRSRGQPRAERAPSDDPRPRVAAAVVGAALTGLWFGGWPAGLAGAVVGMVLGWRIAHEESPAARREAKAIAAALPLVADLLAACAAAGRPTSESISTVARALGGPLGNRLDELGARVALGANAVDEWRRLAGTSSVAPLARTVVRSLETGAPMAAGLARLADDARRELGSAAQARARSVGVKAAAPLALCFLPAFMLIGVVPAVAGALRSLLQ